MSPIGRGRPRSQSNARTRRGKVRRMNLIGRGRPRSQSNARTRQGKVRRMSLIGQDRPAGEQVPAVRLAAAVSKSVVETSIEGGLGGGSIP